MMSNCQLKSIKYLKVPEIIDYENTGINSIVLYGITGGYELMIALKKFIDKDVPSFITLL